ncbi:AMP-binding protein [Mycobacterium sp. M23085]|uniref:AMP-binding protein n=1 Tax=Mycobacterium sp. M23085 TaxID=3378087 RepID=UPI003877B93D
MAARAYTEGWAASELVRAGVLGPLPPAHLPAAVTAVRSFGALGGLPGISAARFGQRAAVIDERGSLSFAELEAYTNAVAHGWRAARLRGGDTVAILARNHRGFVVTLFAAAKCGARIVLLNTDFGNTQLRDVLAREGGDLIVYDEEFAEAVADIDARCGRWQAWTDHHDDGHGWQLDSLARQCNPAPPPAPGVEATLVILTSGTTGTPKGAPRSQPRSLIPVAGLLSKAPFRARGVTECCVPLYHGLGLSHTVLAVALGSTLVIRRRFDPRQTLDSLAHHHATGLIVVPVMLRRILDLDQAVSEWDLSALRIVFVAGSQLGAPLCRRALQAFGPVVHNLYGSTEVAYATIATPADLAVEPGCVGRVVRGATVRILDDGGRSVAHGTTGRIFVANGIQFEGYTGGGGKDVVDGLMSSSDVGHFDRAGRLFIDGRDDDMIISGVENVFPAEIEDTLAGHPDVTEAAAIAVDDPDWGQRLHCFVVRRTDTLTEQDVKDYVKTHLARYKVPRDITFLDALPRNPTGKVLKRDLSAGTAP